jgi:hypothetical protein
MSILRWQGPTQYEDGSAFGAADFAGFTFDIDGAPAVSVPLGWDNDGSYEYEITSLVPPPPAGQRAEHTVRMYTVARNGRTSAPSDPATFVVDLRVPRAPFGVAVSAG